MTWPCLTVDDSLAPFEPRLLKTEFLYVESLTYENEYLLRIETVSVLM